MLASPPFFLFVWESMRLFNVCPTLYCRSQEHRNKKPLFSCRGYNSMLSEPIVLQKLHLLLSCIVYWWCGSGRRLGHNYTASQTSVTAFPYIWISVFSKPKVRTGWINMLSSPALDLKALYCRSTPQRLRLHIHANMMSGSFYQHWLSRSIVSVCLVFGLGQRLCDKP